MAVLQENHIEEAFYQRNRKKFLPTTQSSYLPYDFKSYLSNSNNKYHARSAQTFLEKKNKHNYLSKKNTSYLSKNNNKYQSNSSKEYYSPVKGIHFLETDNEIHLEKDKEIHLEKDNEHHLDEDKENHLEESSGETSNDEDEEFGHIINWNKIIAPGYFLIFDNNNNKKKYKNVLTGKIIKKKPQVLDRMEVFDLTKEELIQNICEYSNNGNWVQEYKNMIKDIDNYQIANLQETCVQNIKHWKQRKGIFYHISI